MCWNSTTPWPTNNIFKDIRDLHGIWLGALENYYNDSSDCHRACQRLIEIRTFLWYNAAGTLCVRLSIKSPPFRNNAIMLVVGLIAIVELRCKTEIFLFEWKCNCVSVSQQENQKALCSSMYRADWMSFELSNTRTFSRAKPTNVYCIANDISVRMSEFHWIISPSI